MLGTGHVFVAGHDGKWFGVLVDEKDRLEASAFSNNKGLLVEHLVRLGKTKHHTDGDHRLIGEMVRAYNGQLPGRVELNLENVSEYQQGVYRMLQKIPRGKVTSYGLIAQAVGSGPRAVGNAVSSNRYAPFVPCHRVVPFNLTIGNYSMNQKPSLEGSNVKRQILENEGVVFQDDHVDITCLWKPPQYRTRD
ncbi:MAG TPA: MGMT family protein [Candidatus Binatus sp.]|nr:MGMT family protein [Candidatus Binatus sp.]